MSRINTISSESTAKAYNSTKKSTSDINQRISQIVSNIKNPLKLSNSSLTPEPTHSESMPKNLCVQENKKIVSKQLGYYNSISRDLRTCDKGILEEFLISNGFQSFLVVFQDNQISYEDLKYLTKQDLNDMKIPVGPRNRFIKFMEGQGDENYTATRPETFLDKSRAKKDTIIKEPGEKKCMKFKHSSRKASMDISFDSEFDFLVTGNSMTETSKDFNEQQYIIMKAIEDNQKIIEFFRKQMDSKTIYSSTYLKNH